ncbi:MAG: DegT/DnrJ/EryC1/StrS family aminotransferase [Firmicutes bacterium]|nr:DegT/DnrJ/EryC1/StrS family aminotransferase [Bacillota bacterium]
MKVPAFDLTEQNRCLRAKLMEAIGEAVDSGHFILGEPVAEFEAGLARLCGVRHAVGVANGSDALYLALAACRIGPGDEVITTPFTFFATAGAVARAGATPVFADIDPVTYNIDPAEIEKRVGPRTKAIIPVHLYGHPADMDPICEVARRNGLKVIEDAAQAIGAEYHERKVGSLGDLACISFFPTKNLGAFGDAGAVVTDDDELAERLRMLRVHGSRQRYYHEMLGINSRLDTLQARILSLKMKHLGEWTEKRRAIATAYAERLAPLLEPGLQSSDAGASGASGAAHPGAAAGWLLRLPSETEGCKHVYHQYTIAARDRDKLKAYLAEKGIGSTVYYPLPLHLQKAFAGLGYRNGDFPVAERAAEGVLSLPVYPEMTAEQVEYVADALAQFK